MRPMSKQQQKRTKKNRIVRKLKSQRGESLIETLASVMISVLGILMFASATASSTKMITTSKKVMNNYYEQSNNLTEEKNGTSTGQVVKVLFTQLPSGVSGLAGSADLAKKQSDLVNNMTVYTNTNKTVASYRTSDPKENDPATIDTEEE